MGRYEQVKKTITMKNPDYVPILFFNKDREQSDIIMIDVVRHFMGTGADLSEWGFRWDRTDKTMGQPVEEIIKTWTDLDKMLIPDPKDKSRFAHVKEHMNFYGSDRYYLASLVLTGFTVLTFLRGFTNTMEDLYLEKEKILKLADIIFGFEEGIICQLSEFGFHGVAFFDDWGTQTNLIVSPSLWRDLFKPRYKKLFDLAHRNGLDVYFHSCGYIYDIIPDFVDIGVDILNLSQPNLYDVKKLGTEYGGKLCFACPVSYQTTSVNGTKEDIYRDVQDLIDNLGVYNGGLIGYVEEYKSIGVSDDNYKHCVNAFRELGKYS